MRKSRAERNAVPEKVETKKGRRPKGKKNNFSMQARMKTTEQNSVILDSVYYGMEWVMHSSMRRELVELAWFFMREKSIGKNMEGSSLTLVLDSLEEED